MRKRFTDKGISLVILIVIITVIGALGAGIVSFMGAKQKSYPAQAQSYQALNLAHAGIEFAIRYAYDRYNQAGQSATDCLGTAVTVNFGNGSFEVQYVGGINYTLKSIGRSGAAIREVMLNKFPGYSMGDGFVLTKTIDSNYSPSAQSQNVSVPLTNLYNQTIYIKNIKVTINPTQGSTNRIQTLSVGGTTAYDFINQIPQNDSTNPNADGQGANRGICIPTPSGGGGCPSGFLNPAQIPYAFNLNLAIPPGSVTEVINFNSASSKGTYNIIFTYDFNTGYANPKEATMTFIIN